CDRHLSPLVTHPHQASLLLIRRQCRAIVPCFRSICQYGGVDLHCNTTCRQLVFGVQWRGIAGE
ncbi:MAG: hypothetical protein P8189_27165, partial [Anaerolineae bacterium]